MNKFSKATLDRTIFHDIKDSHNNYIKFSVFHKFHFKNFKFSAFQFCCKSIVSIEFFINMATAEAVLAMSEYLKWQNISNQIPIFEGKETELRSFFQDLESAFACMGNDADEKEFVKRVIKEYRRIKF